MLIADFIFNINILSSLVLIIINNIIYVDISLIFNMDFFVLFLFIFFAINFLQCLKILISINIIQFNL